jgi:hypothetical protein
VVNLEESRASLDQASGILQGAVDAHVHAAPDIQARKIDCLELVQEARKKGMGGILIKDHATLTADRAYILNKIFPDFKVYGAIVLNDPVGGINPAATEAAIRLGCREVFMPTYAARNHLSRWGKGSGLSGYPLWPHDQGISPIDDSGKLSLEVQETLRLIAQADVLLGTGHLSPPEIGILLKLAQEARVQRILVTHASMTLIGMSVENQLDAIRLGAYIEHSFVVTTEWFAGRGKTTVDEIAFQIRSTGVEHCVMSTDFGQAANPSPIEGLEEFVRQMWSRGFTEREISLMIRENPKKLLER